ncbi:MAG: hypothetical protein JW908_16705 [Anaerolineales bacterium]|nr:hypothetical protein [Anaerolineales bacterium]
MTEKKPSPWWAPVFFGFVMIFMGSLITYLLIWVIPESRSAANAPSWVLAAIAGGFFLGGILLITPQKTPAIIRSLLGFTTIILVAIVCNWTAFAPGMHYTSEVSLGPVSVSGEDQIGGRIMFGLAALAVDALLGWMVYYEVRKRIRK